MWRYLHPGGAGLNNCTFASFFTYMVRIDLLQIQTYCMVKSNLMQYIEWYCLAYFIDCVQIRVMVLGCFLLSLFKYVGLFCLVLCFKGGEGLIYKKNVCKHGSQVEPYTVSLTLTYVKCVFLGTIHFRWFHNFWPWPWSLTSFWKTLILAIFWLLFSDGCRPVSVVVFWQLLFKIWLSLVLLIHRLMNI